MIFKFIDKNGSEITVNSLSSLQALVDSETVKEDTKVKAGLRGKWTLASKIDELVFAQGIEEEIPTPKVDIKSFITEEKNNEEDTDTYSSDESECSESSNSSTSYQLLQNATISSQLNTLRIFSYINLVMNVIIICNL